MMKEITSTKNETYKYIKSLKTKKARMKTRQYTIEGIKSVRDAISAGADIDFIAVSDKLQESFNFTNIYMVADEIFAPLCDTDTPQGVLAVINMPDADEKALDRDLYLLCDKVNDPGNMGTIIRICDAADCGLLLMEDTVDIYSPKTVRASMGSFFHIKAKCGLTKADILKMKEDGYKIISGALTDNTIDFKDADYSGKTIIVVGNEANGITDEILSISDTIVKIPIYGQAESLNVAVAASLLVYEAKR